LLKFFVLSAFIPIPTRSNR